MAAIGSQFLQNNTTITETVAVEYRSAINSSIGSYKISIGLKLLASITTSSNNTAMRTLTLASNNTTQSGNTAVGNSSLATYNNTAVGNNS